MKSELDKIIAKQSPEMAKLTRAVLAKLRPRFPGAVELVYDKRRSVVVGFCPDERASNVINSIVPTRSGSSCTSSRAIRFRIPRASFKAPGPW